MASTLKINTLTGVTTAGSIAVTGEGNSTTTNLQQGLCKAWFNYRHDTNTLNDSFNISSVTDESNGHHFGNYNNNMSNAHSATPTMGDSFRCRFEGNLEQTSARTDTIEGYNSSGAAADTPHSVCTIVGDLA